MKEALIYQLIADAVCGGLFLFIACLCLKILMGRDE